MPVENLPHWTIMPNWRQPINERLEWLTAVLPSEAGAEQRFALRWSPRRSFEALMTPVRESRTLFDLAVGAAGGVRWYVPVWHDIEVLTAPLAEDALTLAVNTEHRDYREGGFVFLRGSDFESEVLEIASLTDEEITFVEGPSRDWPVGTQVFPAVVARIVEQPSMKRFASRAMENSVRFLVDDENDVEAEALSETYDGFPVLTAVANEIRDISHAYERIMDEIDGQVGLVSRVDTAGLGLTVQTHNWLSVGRPERATLRKQFYALAGRCNPLWVPTFADDLYLVAAAASGTSTIEIARCGFTAFGGPRHNRRDLQFTMADGTRFYRRITGSAHTLAGTETVNLATPLPVDVSPETVIRISFMALCRQESDAVEFVHRTAGVSEVSSNFRSAPDIRVASDWSPAPFPFIDQTDEPCGSLCTPAIALSEGHSPHFITSGETGNSIGYVTIVRDFFGYMFVGYTNGSLANPRFRNVDGDFNVSSEIEISGSAADVVGVEAHRSLPMDLVYDTTAFDYRLITSSGGVHTFDATDPAFTPVASHSISAGGVVVGLSMDGADYRAVMLNEGASVSFGAWEVGDPPLAGTVIAAGNYDQAHATPLTNLFATWAVVVHDADTGRIRLGVVSFYDETFVAPVPVSTGGGADERLLDVRFLDIPNRFCTVWRRYDGVGPAGSVRMRLHNGALDDPGDEITIYNLSPLTVSGYTHLANREPVCAFVLPNQNVLVVERRYEAVGAQLRAYEVLVLHAPLEGQKTSNVFRLTPPGVGPTGDVQRVAAVRPMVVDTEYATVAVAYVRPTDNSGATELVWIEVTVSTCSSMDEPE